MEVDHMLANKTAGQALTIQHTGKELQAVKQMTKQCQWGQDLFHESTWIVETNSSVRSSS